jgi:hypothetical protein
LKPVDHSVSAGFCHAVNADQRRDAIALKSGVPRADELEVSHFHSSSYPAIAGDTGPGDPLSRLTRAYDRSVLACNSTNFVKAHRSIGLLRASLDLDSEASRTFDKLFQWCEGQLDRGNYAAASRSLAAMRGAWVAATFARSLARTGASARHGSARQAESPFA